MEGTQLSVLLKGWFFFQTGTIYTKNATSHCQRDHKFESPYNHIELPPKKNTVICCFFSGPIPTGVSVEVSN